MSESDDERKRRDAERGSGLAKSGSAKEIGAALGGDLDFEPDALLDSLLSDDEPAGEPTRTAKAVASPAETPPSPAPAPIEEATVAPGGHAPTSMPGRKLHEPEVRHWAADEVTVISRAPAGVPSESSEPAAPPARDEVDELLGEDWGDDSLDESTPPPRRLSQYDIDELAAAIVLPDTASVGRDSIEDLDADEVAELLSEPDIEPERLPSFSYPDEADSFRDEATSLDRESLEDLDADEVSELPVRSERPSAPLRPSSTPMWPDERPATEHLSERGLLEDFVARAEWLEEEAHLVTDPEVKGRTLIVASELWAMSGDVERAREVATEAQFAAAAQPLAGRQLRWLAAADADWKAVAAGLESELRTSQTNVARAHTACFASDVHRLAFGDMAGSLKKLDIAARALPSDPRPFVAKLGEQLGASVAAPRLRTPEGLELAPLAAALAELVQLRGGPPAEPVATPLLNLEAARRALAARDGQKAAEALQSLASEPELSGPSTWLASLLLAPSQATRNTSIELLRGLLSQSPGPELFRALAARAVEQGDRAALAAALQADSESFAFATADRVALGTLTNTSSDAIRGPAAELATDSAWQPLAAAALAASRAPDAEPAGDARARAAQRLGRAIGALPPAPNAEPTLEAVREPFEVFAASDPQHPLVHTLALELALEARAAEPLATALAAHGDGAVRSAGRLTAAIVLELAHRSDLAQQHYAAVAEEDPKNEAAIRALIAAEPDRAAELLVALADASEDGVRQSLALFEATLRFGFDDLTTAEALLRRAAEAAPGLPFAHRVGEQLSRARGDADALLEWLEARHETTDDPIERALDLVREALLTADQDVGGAASLLARAIEARPSDVALHELYERVATSTPAERAGWREAIAAEAPDDIQRPLLLEAALEHEQAGNLEAAAEAARKATELGGGEVARVFAARLAALGPGVAQLSEALLAEARAAEDPAAQSELYERLAALDRIRGDKQGAMLWQHAIVEQNPEYLPALRRIEHALIGEGRDDELGPTAAALAKLLDPGEASAHAWIAARLRARAGEWESAREMAQLVATGDEAPLWALRELEAHARAAADDAALYDAESRLSERQARALDAATLSLRAAEAAARLDRMAEARDLLDKALELAPHHLVALMTQAELFEASGELRGAAEALETLAEASAIETHRVNAWLQAGTMWLDRVEDTARGVQALERAAQIDVSSEEVFSRLRAAYVAAGERTKLAELLERRLAGTTDPAERIALEVTRGRALAEVGEREQARRALAAALDANPDHVDALSAFVDLCLSEEDWRGAEQALVRLVRHTPEPAKQAEIYRRLGELYDAHLENPQRAELSYREVQKRLPDDDDAVVRLIGVYGRLGAPEKAVELQTGLLERATNPEQQKARTLGLALVQETIALDRKKAEAILDKARKTWPQDAGVLRGLAEFHQRGGQGTAFSVLLDRSAADARRALNTGRFEAGFFSTLATVAELRGDQQMAIVAHSTLAALEGQESALVGAGAAALDRRLDDLMAPELLGSALRMLMQKTGDALDQAFAVDLRTLRAAALPAGSPIGADVQALASASGIHNLEILVSPTLGPVCIAASSNPARLLIGQSLVDSADDAVRTFLVIRALKQLQSRVGALSRAAPIELWPMMAALLGLFAPSFTPQGGDARRIAEAQQRIQPALPARIESDVATLALEVIGNIGTRASQLGVAVNEWGDRTALLATGDPSVAIRALGLGQTSGVPAEGAERVKWIVRNPEARDLAVFSVSDNYAEARRKAGLG